MSTEAIFFVATETIRRGMLCKKAASASGCSKLGTADAATLFCGVALNDATLGQAVALATVPGEQVVIYADGAAQLVEGSTWGPSAVVAGAASGSPSSALGLVLQTVPNTAGALGAAIVQPAAGSGGGGAVDLQQAYDNGYFIATSPGEPVAVVVDTTDLEAIEVFDTDGVTSLGTISGFGGGGGGLALYGSAAEGARIACRTQTGSNTGATAAVVGGRGGPTAGTGGETLVQAGQGGTTNGVGGQARVIGGLGTGTGNGGAASVTGGGNGGTGTGGAASVVGGASTGASGTGGAASLTGGASTNGTGGSVSINAGDGATDGDVNIGTSKAVNTNVQAATAVGVKLQGQTNGAIAIDVSSTTLRGANANNNCISLSANGIGGAPKLSFFGAATVVQQATPVTLGDVIALLQAYGLCP